MFIWLRKWLRLPVYADRCRHSHCLQCCRCRRCVEINRRRGHVRELAEAKRIAREEGRESGRLWGLREAARQGVNGSE